MDVTVETQCSRCDRKDEKRVSLEVAQQMEQQVHERETVQHEVMSDLEEMLQKLGSNAPALMIARQTPNGAFEIRALNDLCHAPEAKRNKGCQTRVDFLVKEIFMENPKPEPKPKAPGKGKGKKNKAKDTGSSEGGEA